MSTELTNEIINKFVASVDNEYVLFKSLFELDRDNVLKCIKVLNNQFEFMPGFIPHLEKLINSDLKSSFPRILKSFNDITLCLFNLVVVNERVMKYLEESKFVDFKVTEKETGSTNLCYPVNEYLYDDMTVMLATLPGAVDAILEGNIKVNSKLLMNLPFLDWERISSELFNSKAKDDILLTILADSECWEIFSRIITPSQLEDVIKNCAKPGILGWYLPCRVSFKEIDKVCEEYPWSDKYYNVTEKAKECYRELSYYHDNKDIDLLRHSIDNLTKACRFDYVNSPVPTLHGTIMRTYNEYLFNN